MSPVRRWAPVAYPAFLVGLTAFQAVAPQRSGPLALAQVFAPWMFLPLLALLPHAVLLPTRRLLVALLAAGLAFTVHLGPDLVPSGPSTPDPAAVPVRVTSWNVLFSNSPRMVTETVAAADSDVVGLVEVTRRQTATLKVDTTLKARYPAMVLHPEASRALLSRYPVLESGIKLDPTGRPGTAVLWARLDLGAGRALSVFVAHPLPARAAPSSELPLSWEAAPRDAEIRFVRSLVDAEIAAGRRVLVMGDFNVTDREPGGRALVRGLRDAYEVAGWGGGASWAPLAFRRRGIALVRIDRVLGGPGTAPTAFDTDCTLYGSDHCVLHATLAISP